MLKIAVALACAVMASTGTPQEAPVNLPFPADLMGPLDSYVASAMREQGIPGGAIAIVWTGNAGAASLYDPYLRAYGQASLEPLREADAETTMFRLASITKLFTWISVMQLAEQGKLNLDTDINAYTGKVQLPDTFAEPITMRHLMTHTPGLEDVLIGLWSRSAESMVPMETLLLRQKPARTMPPGRIAAYSNYGTALAGHAVAVVSGMPWEAYVEQHIFEPLGMAYTTVRQPTPARFQPHTAQGYFGKLPPREGSAEYLRMRAAGAGKSSARDMALFMREILAGDTLLSREAYETMLTVQHRHHEAFAGIAHGFFQMPLGPFIGIGHTGDSTLHHSSMMLLPEHGLGVFAAFNHADSTELARGVIVRLLELSSTAELLTPAPSEARDTSEYAGSYGSARRANHDITKLNALIDRLEIRAEQPGEIIASGRGLEPGTTLYEIEPGIFHAGENAKGIAFLRDDNGQIEYAALGHAPLVDYERLPWYATPNATIAFAAGSAVVCLFIVIAKVLLAIGRRGRTGPDAGIVAIGQWAGSLACLAVVAAFICLALALQQPLEILFGMYPLMRAAQVLAWLAIALGTLLLVAALLALPLPAARAGEKTGLLLTAVPVAAGGWWFYFWGLLGI